MALILSEFEGDNERTARYGSNCKEVSAISGATGVIQYPARSENCLVGISWGPTSFMLSGYQK